MKVLRILLIFFLIIPLACQGVGMESCRLEGKINGQKVTLNWTYLYSEEAEGFSLKGSSIYGFCTIWAKDELSPYEMRCAAKWDGKQTVYYETLNGGGNAGSMFMCKKGCNQNIAPKFVLVCDDNDE